MQQNEIKPQRKRKRRSSPKITFTLTKTELAHGLAAIQYLDPTYHPTSLNQLVRLAYRDYITKMSVARSTMPNNNVMEEITQLMERTKSGVESLKKEISGQELMNRISLDIQQGTEVTQQKLKAIENDEAMLRRFKQEKEDQVRKAQNTRHKEGIERIQNGQTKDKVMDLSPLDLDELQALQEKD